MKTKLLLFLLFVTSFASAQLATFGTTSAFNITSTSGTALTTITTTNTATVYIQVATGSSGNVNLVPLQSAGSSSAGTYVNSINLTGLAQNTVYYYRFRADNNAGSAFSGTGSFTTLSTTVAVPSISGQSASAINSTTATINYTLNANNAATTSIVKYGLSAANLNNQVTGTSATGNAPTSANAPLTGLLPSTQYFYQIEATNSEGTIVGTTVGNFTTLQAVLTFNNLASSAITSSTATVSVDLANVCSGALYRLQYATSAAFGAGTEDGGYATGGTGGTKNHNLTGLSPSTTYYFRYYAPAGQACNAAQIVSVTESFTTPPPFPIITYITASPSSSGATINYALTSFSSATTSIVRYGLSAGSLPNQVVGFSANSSSSIAGSAMITALQPNTQYFYQIETTNGGGTTNSAILNFTTTSVPTLPVISAISTTLSSNSAVINYSINANNATTSSIVRYGLNSSNLSSNVAGFAANGNTNIAGTAAITGLQPNTQYFYAIYATNSLGTIAASSLSFITPAVGAPIAEYNFDNTYNNVAGNTPFSSNAGTSFVTGRDGVTPNGAININNSNATVATIPLLPLGNTARSISVWAKANSFLSGGYNWIFSYGQESSAGSAQAGSFTQSDVSYLGYFTNLFTNTNVTHAVSTWYHFVYVYDGTIASIYRNGVLIRSSAISWNTVNNNNIFKLGVAFGNTAGFNGAIDDLKIYNYALTQSDITSLFTNNTLSSPNFSKNNAEVAIYPNPTNNVLNIEMANEVESVEIYTLLGQKVLDSKSKKVNVSSLATGIYMVRIKDTENATSTKKFVKN